MVQHWYGGAAIQTRLLIPAYQPTWSAKPSFESSKLRWPSETFETIAEPVDMKLGSGVGRLFTIAAGLFFAVAMLVVSIALAGYGHGGWGWALLPSILGVAGFPLAFSAWTVAQERGRSRSVISLALAFLSDILVLPGVVLEWESLAEAPLGSTLWVTLLVGWHVVAATRLSTVRTKFSP